MATFIAYQPNKPFFRSDGFGKSSAIGLYSPLSRNDHSSTPQPARPVSNTDFVAKVDLITFEQDAAREYLVAREILEPMAHDPNKRGDQVAGARSNDVTESDKIEDGEEFDTDEDDDADIDNDHESEVCDLPSLTDIFSRNNSKFGGSTDLRGKASAPPAPVDRTGKERLREGDSENNANPAATTTAGIQPGASQGE